MTKKKELDNKPKYNEKMKERIHDLYLAGLTDAQVASVIGINRNTLYEWKKKHPEIAELSKIKDIADFQVEQSLYHRAIGYTYDSEKIFYNQKTGQVVRVPIKVHVPPDTTSMIFWLKNRQREKWRDVRHEEVTTRSANTRELKVTFQQFCERAGYPAPFPKQVEMMEFGLTGEDPRLLLGARGYGKTDYVTVLGIAYDVYEDYIDFINGDRDSLVSTNLIISKSQTRNTAMCNSIAEALKLNGVELEKENSTVLRVKGLVGKDHSVEVLTIKSSFRGRHPKRIICDDPVTEEDTSDAMRQLVKNKYDEAYKLCKNICVIGQPAHAFDLYSELRPIIKKLEVPHGSIPELDADLEAMKLAGVDEKSIQMSYHLQVPVASDNAFAKIKYLDQFPQGATSVAFIDPSFEGGDYTAMSIVTAYFQGIAVQGKVWKKAWYDCLPEIVQAIKEFNVHKLCFETNALGEQPISLLRQNVPQGVGVVGKKSLGNKHARIMAAGGFGHLIHLSKTSDKVYIDQVVKYEYKATNDDAPDSLASCMEWIGLIKGQK